MSAPEELARKIKTLAKQLGRSELEIAELLLNNAERLLGEADITDKRVSLDRTIADSFEERRRILDGVGRLNTDLAELKTTATERKNILASICLAIAKQRGFARPMPAISTDVELHQEFGVIDTEGRTYPSPEPRVYTKDKPADAATAPTDANKTTEDANKKKKR